MSTPLEPHQAVPPATFASVVSLETYEFKTFLTESRAHAAFDRALVLIPEDFESAGLFNSKSPLEALARGLLGAKLLPKAMDGFHHRYSEQVRHRGGNAVAATLAFSADHSERLRDAMRECLSRLSAITATRPADSLGVTEDHLRSVQKRLARYAGDPFALKYFIADDLLDSPRVTASETLPLASHSLGDDLVAHGLLTAEQLQHAKTLQDAAKRSLTAIVAEEGMVAEDVLLNWLGSRFHVQILSRWFMEGADPADNILALIPESLALEHCVFPVSSAHDGLIVAIDDPSNSVALAAAEASAGCPLVLRLGTRPCIQAAIHRRYGQSSHHSGASHQAGPGSESLALTKHLRTYAKQVEGDALGTFMTQAGGHLQRDIADFNVTLTSAGISMALAKLAEAWVELERWRFDEHAHPC